MNDLCAEIGCRSINHYGEQLCGDHVDIVERDENSTVLVLADGLGSGVKASILSTLTSKIISTMMAEGLTVEDCVETIAQTLPICSVRGVAYSTFTIMHLVNNQEMELIQYDNPLVILLRDGKNYDYPFAKTVQYFDSDYSQTGGGRYFHRHERRLPSCGYRYRLQLWLEAGGHHSVHGNDVCGRVCRQVVIHHSD